MHTYTASVSWSRGDQPFTDNRYSRGHAWRFDGGAEVRASSSPLSVPLPMSDPTGVDPEEALVAATSSCHMLFFLSLAAARGLVVDSYQDEPYGLMDRTMVTRIVLRPAIAFAGAAPTQAVLDEMHHEAHARCYIANSIKAEVVVEAR